MADSTSRDGSDTKPKVASDSVTECATVKLVTMRKTSQNAGVKRSTGCQRRATHTPTAGSSSESRNRMWSKPIQMCHTPSAK